MDKIIESGHRAQLHFLYTVEKTAAVRPRLSVPAHADEQKQKKQPITRVRDLTKRKQMKTWR